MMGFGGFGMFGGIGMIPFLGAFIWLIVWLINKNKESERQNTSNPLEIIKERYAKGEFTKKQYEEMKKEIRG